MSRRECTCAGTAPGYPAHEDWCGKPEGEDVFPHEESVSLLPNDRSMREDEGANKARPPITGVDAPRATSDPLVERGLLVTISPRQSDENPQARPTLFGASPKLPAPAEKHWFVPDETGYYCQACHLPPSNGRHTPRPAA